MSRITLLVIFLLCALTLGYQRFQSGDLRLLIGAPCAEEMALLRSHGATCREDLCGFWIKPDSAGVTGLFQLYRFHTLCRDLAETNIANCHTAKTADGTPYRRQLAVLDSAGEIQIRTDQGDFRWIYDPTNPNSETEGHHKGYVAMPNVNAQMEAINARRHRRFASVYERALRKMESLNDHLVAWRTGDVGSTGDSVEDLDCSAPFRRSSLTERMLTTLLR